VENKNIEEWTASDIKKWLSEEMKNFSNELKLESLCKLTAKHLFLLQEDQIFKIYTKQNVNEDSRKEAAANLFNLIQSLKEKQKRRNNIFLGII